MRGGGQRRTAVARTVSGLVVALVLLAGCTGEDASDDGSGDDAQGDATLVISDMAFSPSSVVITAGAQLTIRNDDGVAHTVTATDGSFDVRLEGGAGQSASLSIEEPGTYPFACSIHPSMTGELVVSG